MNSEITTWLESLKPDQLELVRKKVSELVEQKKSIVKNPGAFSVKDLAGNLDIDISSLERQIKSTTRRH